MSREAWSVRDSVFPRTGERRSSCQSAPAVCGVQPVTRRDTMALLAAVAVPLALIAVLIPFRSGVPNTDAALALILVIVGVAAPGRRLAGTLAAISAAVWFDWTIRSLGAAARIIPAEAERVGLSFPAELRAASATPPFAAEAGSSSRRRFAASGTTRPADRRRVRWSGPSARESR